MGKNKHKHKSDSYGVGGGKPGPNAAASGSSSSSAGMKHKPPAALLTGFQRQPNPAHGAAKVHSKTGSHSPARSPGAAGAGSGNLAAGAAMGKGHGNSSGGSSGSSSNTAGKSSGSGGSKLSALQQQFAKKLEGSRFRVINERLYTTSGATAFEEFQTQPTLFNAYHEGFRAQAAGWPVNPLHPIIEWIRKKHPRATVADMGCGDAQLAEALQGGGNTVHSFDLVSINPRVTACDIAHTPLADASVDIVVFCLSLMGTNIGDFLLEACRVLKPGGALRIVEVRSRFEGETDGVRKFIKTLRKAGFDVLGGEGMETEIGTGNEDAEPAGQGQGHGQDNGNGNGNGKEKGSKNKDKKKKIAVDRNGYEVERRDGNNKMFFEVEARKAQDRQGDASLQYSAKACIYKRR